MRKFLLLAALAGCGDNIHQPTWGEAMTALSQIYCGAQAQCGWYGDIPLCVEHTQFHLCEPYHNCDEPTMNFDEVKAALDACDAAVRTEAYLDPASYECFALYYYGYVPDECFDVLELAPADPTLPDGGTDD